jgi:hypothetical protein
MRWDPSYAANTNNVKMVSRKANYFDCFGTSVTSSTGVGSGVLAAV